MLGRIVRDLTLSDLTFGGGPLLLAVLAFVKAARVDDAYARWSWIACAVIMLVVCAAYLIGVWRRRAQLQEE
ncbi:hypothetical protein AB0F81_37570 [Actinoplanes sp. NPDC024001]|uniref:hypothetical protein n=1 Tax=Actinoplanes sp. NPDC024001 TaxID=3154598 RepID=UPI0033C2C92F